MAQTPDSGENPTTPSRLTIPLFPLPDVVLFPGVVLPLHVFEERYRRLVADVLRGDRRLGMALLKPGWQADYEGNPPVYPVVGYGRIESAGRLPDGRYHIRLLGEGKGRIESELAPGPYRRAVVCPSPDGPAGPDLGTWVERIASLLAELELLAEEAEGLDGEPIGASSPPLAAGEPAARASGIEFVHLVASEITLAPEVKLGLLALDDPIERARRVAGLLDDLLVKRHAIEHHRPGRGDPRAN
jgi:Lon protease-like protein